MVRGEQSSPAPHANISRAYVSFVVRSLHARALRAPLRNRTWLARGGAFTAPLASQRSVHFQSANQPARPLVAERAGRCPPPTPPLPIQRDVPVRTPLLRNVPAVHLDRHRRQ